MQDKKNGNGNDDDNGDAFDNPCEKREEEEEPEKHSTEKKNVIMKEPTPWKDQLNSASKEHSARIGAIVNVVSYGILGGTWWIFSQRETLLKFKETEPTFLSQYFTFILIILMSLPVIVLLLDYLQHYASYSSCEAEKIKYNKNKNESGVAEAEKYSSYDKKHWGYIWSRKYLQLKQVLLVIAVVIFIWFIAQVIMI